MKCRLTTNCLTVVMNLYMFNLTIYILAVGCEHTGYKSLMAGLVTEWIYDAFAGKSSFQCITFFFTRLYELTNHCVDTLACIFRF